MAIPAPPQVDAALEQLTQSLQALEGRPVDPEKLSWAELEKSVIKLLGGAFDIERPEHQVVGLGLAGVLARKYAAEHGAFWFRNRESLEGAALGFPDGIIVLSPFSAVVDALGKARLAVLDDVTADIRKSLAQVKFAPQGGALGGMRLSPLDYERLFDPGFLQFTVLSPQKAKAVWESPVAKVITDLRDAISRASQLPPEAKKQLETQLVGGLQRMDLSKPLVEQVEKAPRLVEMMGHLFASLGGTGSAPEEFWLDVAMPLLFIGTPAQFPPLDEDDLEAFRKGVDPVILFVDLVPYQSPAQEEGLLGVFPVDKLQLPHAALARGGNVHLIKVEAERIQPLLNSFDPQKTKDAVTRFAAYLQEKAGQKPETNASAQAMLDGALTLLTELKQSCAKATQEKADLCVRRVTEAEASSEPALHLIRTALSAPRIILA